MMTVTFCMIFKKKHKTNKTLLAAGHAVLGMSKGRIIRKKQSCISKEELTQSSKAFPSLLNVLGTVRHSQEMLKEEPTIIMCLCN